jgi:hypothetical protein
MEYLIEKTLGLGSPHGHSGENTSGITSFISVAWFALVQGSGCVRRLLRNSRKTERGAKQFLTHLAVRAAPFALLSNSPQNGACVAARGQAVALGN